MASNPMKGYLLKGGVALLLVAILVGGYFALSSFLGNKSDKKPNQVMISVLKPPPPPPPPKPPEKPPEPPKIKDEVKVPEIKDDQPKPAEDKPADNKPASDKPLGVDAEAGAGNDGFGLAGNKGGRDFLSTGGGSGNYYTGLVQRQFYLDLMKNRNLAKTDFKVGVIVWIAANGKVDRVELESPTGDKPTDELIKTTFMDMPALREIPPPHLREIHLRIANRT